MTKRQAAFIEFLENHRAAYERGELSMNALSRLLQQRYPTLWETYEGARSYVRSITGNKPQDRVTTIIPLKAMSKSEGVKASLGWPTTEAKVRAPLILISPEFKGRSLIGVLSDVHIPYHVPDALDAAVAYFKKHKIDTLILNGDFLDCAELSEHEKHIGQPSTADEVIRGREALAYIRHLFPKARIIYKLGNHEMRWGRRINKQLPAIASILEMEGQYFNFGKIMHLDRYGIELVSDPVAIKVHDLNVLHGHELGPGGGVNPARWLHLNAGASAICGHFHRISAHEESSINDDDIRTYSMGCLCDLKPEYRPFASKKWRHGFALIKVEDARWTVWNKSIRNGVVLE